MAIFDCFQYFNEDHIVDLRLNILNKYVDELQVNLDKPRLKNTMKSLYTEAQDLEI